MKVATNQLHEPLALMANRLALFSGGVLLVAIVLHRLFSFPSPIAINMAAAAIAGAGLAVLLGLAAVARIWIRGRVGAWSAAGGIIFGSLLLLWPALYLPAWRSLPRINDLTTDTQNPPRLNQLAKLRGEGANRVSYPGDAFARAQIDAYPDVRPLVVDRSAEEVFDLIIDTMRGRRGLGWKIAAEEPPVLRPEKPGIIEATERTLVLGFTDDIVVRVSGNERQARIDIRSASRYGRHDFGANAARIRRFLQMVQTRLETVSPSGVAGRGGGYRATRAEPVAGGLKRPQERSTEKAAPGSERDRAQQDGRRAPAPKDRPRG